MAKLISQNSSKPKTAKTRTATSRTTSEERNPKLPGNGTANLKRKPPDSTSNSTITEPIEMIISAVASTNGHAAYPPRLSQPDSSLDLQERVRDMVKLAKEQGYVTYDDINEALPENMADPEEMELLISRLRAMEVDIIDASEVDRYKDGKKDVDDEDEEKDQKLDILDDPVRMYLKQMGQVPLLTREQEVEISKRIEDAELMVQKFITRFGFIARAHLDLAQKLIEGRERFDRVILDKKIESRERYMKALPKLCAQVERAGEDAQARYRSWVAARGTNKESGARTEFQRSHTALMKLYPRFYFKQKVTEEFVQLADDQQRLFSNLHTEIARAENAGTTARERLAQYKNR